MVVINLNDPNVWLHACKQWVALFWHVMLIAMDNLVIIQNQYTLCYVPIWRGGYLVRVCRFKLGDYVYLQQITFIMLDVNVGHVILLLEGFDNKTWKYHV
jgi:hypothetical protein